MRIDLTPEDELCLLLSRGRLSPNVQERTRELLDSPLRWDQVLGRIREHGVLPLFYRSLKALQFRGVPGDAHTELRAAFRKNALRNEFLSRKLGRVLRELKGAGVPVIPLKGVTLAESIYGDAALRVCSDIDILVPAHEVLRARRLVLSQGYTSPFSEDFFLHHQLRTSADCPLLPQKEEAFPYLLEVHWTLLQHSSKDAEAMKDLWSQARATIFFGVPAYDLTPEWQFLYLAEHAAYHKWNTLKWLADIHELMVAAPLDWPQVQAKAVRFDLDTVVESTLTACAQLYESPIPGGMTARPLPAGVVLYPNSLSPSAVWTSPLFYPKLLKRPAEKLRWWAQMFFVARLADRHVFPLPPSLSFLYYALRPLRLACKWTLLGVQAAFRRLRGTRPS